ncbi:MAG: amidohydrolase family protein [Desulfuromonas sp.]|nr:amidohydrolase family protein [Desulfuromonas sp.]
MKLYQSRYLVPVSSSAQENGAIVVDGEQIVAVGSTQSLKIEFPKAEVVDFGDSILLPTLVNAHTHLELSDFAQWAVETAQPQAEAATFTDWILRLIRIKIALGVDVERYRRSWLAGLEQSLASGCGLLGDVLATPDFYATVAEQLPGRCFIEVLGQDPQRVYSQWQRLDHCIENWPDAHWGAAPHAPYTVSEDLLKQSYRYTTSHHLRSSIHIAESADEMEYLQHNRGPMAELLYPFVGWQHHLSQPRNIRPLAALQRAGGLNPGTLLVHGVYLDDNEIAAVADSGCSMVLCPRSNAQLNCGVAPAAAYLRAGVPLALGTDSLASNESLSMWDEMAFALDWFSGQLSAQQLLHMATIGGAQALGFSDTGHLAVNTRASFQVLSPQHLPELDRIYPFLCDRERNNDVSLVVINGTIRHQAGKQEENQAENKKDVPC